MFDELTFGQKYSIISQLSKENLHKLFSSQIFSGVDIANISESIENLVKLRNAIAHHKILLDDKRQGNMDSKKNFNSKKIVISINNLLQNSNYKYTFNDKLNKLKENLIKKGNNIDPRVYDKIFVLIQWIFNI